MPDEIYPADGEIENGTFRGRWHFSFDMYEDPDYMGFGHLRVFNDDTLSPGAIWPLHYHRDIEVITYCAEGEFKHADQHGPDGVLKKGWAQHTTAGSGIYHSEINNLKDKPMRFIQMWFHPDRLGLTPSAEQKAVDKKERVNRLFSVIDNNVPGALRIHQDARVYSSFLEKSHTVDHSMDASHGAYFYVLEGGPVLLNGMQMPALSAAMILGEQQLHIGSLGDSELLLVDVGAL